MRNLLARKSINTEFQYLCGKLVYYDVEVLGFWIILGFILVATGYHGYDFFYTPILALLVGLLFIGIIGTQYILKTKGA